MKKLMILAAALAAFLPTLSLAHSGEYVSYEWASSVTTTSGVALNSLVIDTSDLESLTFDVEATTSTRTMTVSCLAADKTTALFSFPALTVTAGSKFRQEYRADTVIPSSLPTGVTLYNVPLCRYMQAAMPAVNGTAKLNVIGRRQQVAASVITNFYESGSITAGAALTTGVIDTSRARSITVIAEATTTNRTLVVSCTDSAGTSLFDYASLTVTAGSQFMRVVRADSSVPGSEPTNVVHLPVTPCRWMTATIAAAGAASAKVAAYVRN
jgi:hypothetical protein